MSQVKLVVCEGYGNQGVPRKLGSERVVDLDLRVSDTHDIMGIIRTDFDTDTDGSARMSDQRTPAIRYERINDLVGKLLTLIDSMFSDTEQRKAAKELFMRTAWNWYDGQVDELHEPWLADKLPRTTAMKKQEHDEIFGKVDAE